jgi:2',3'-cyclic-nucleotide 2'-phosphodiesterase (5'-nucleotidase family)
VNVTLVQVVSEFNNLLKFDATTLGNHEFDDKIAGLVPFMKVTTMQAQSSVQ